MRLISALIIIILLAIPGSAAEQTWEVKTGYNFLALEVTPAQSVTSEDLLKTWPELQSIFYFDSTSQSFKFQLSLASGGLFGNAFNLTPLKGIILHAKSTISIPWQGTAASGDPFANTTSGFIFAGLPTAAGTASDLLNRLGGYQSVFNWDDVQQRFGFILRLSNGNFFGNDFNLESGKGYFLRYDGPRQTGQGRFRLDGQIRISGLLNSGYVPASGATVSFAGINTIADSKGIFSIQSSLLPLGTQELQIKLGELSLSRLISASDPLQHMIDWQYDRLTGKHLFTDVRIDAAASGVLGVSCTLTARSGATDLELASNILTPVADTLSQPTIFSRINDALTTAWLTADSASILQGFNVEKDFSAFLASQNVIFRPLLKTISFYQLPARIVVGSGIPIQTTATWSDGITSTVPDDHLFSVDNGSLATVTDSSLIATGAGTIIVKVTSRELETTAAVELIASPLKSQWVTDPSSGSFRVALDFNSAAAVTLRYAIAGNPLSESISSTSATQHLLTLENLQPLTVYSWQLEVTGTDTLNLNDNGTAFSFTTPAIPTSPTAPRSLGLRVLNSSSPLDPGVPIPGVLCLIKSGNSWPLSALTDTNGLILVSLSNMRDSTTNSLMTLTTGSTVTIDLYHSSGSSTGNNYVLSGATPDVAGTFTLP